PDDLHSAAADSGAAQSGELRRYSAGKQRDFYSGGQVGRVGFGRPLHGHCLWAEADHNAHQRSGEREEPAREVHHPAGTRASVRGKRVDRSGDRRLQGRGFAAMRQITGFALVLVLVGTGGNLCFAQSKPMAAMRQPGGIQPSSAAETGVVPLTYPYSISTEPHFAVFVEYPKADSIRRIALGDSNYFLAEADKTDPHYAIVKQIEPPAAKSKTPVETNMLVYMASGHVVNITLKAGKLE